jgi:hypothetical protein
MVGASKVKIKSAKCKGVESLRGGLFYSQAGTLVLRYSQPRAAVPHYNNSFAPLGLKMEIISCPVVCPEFSLTIVGKGGKVFRAGRHVVIGNFGG